MSPRDANTIMPNFDGGNVFVSEFAALRLMGISSNAAAVDAVLRDMQTLNPSFVGWSFEFAGMAWLFKAVCGSQNIELVDRVSKKPEIWPLHHQVRVDFDARHPALARQNNAIPLETLSLDTLESGTLYLPFAWNQGCFDALLVKREDAEGDDSSGGITLNFLQFTRAKRHSLKLRYIAAILSHLGGFEVKRRQGLRACKGGSDNSLGADITSIIKEITVVVTIIEPDSQREKVATDLIGSLEPFPECELKYAFVRGLNDVKAV